MNGEKFFALGLVHSSKFWTIVISFYEIGKGLSEIQKGDVILVLQKQENTDPRGSTRYFAINETQTITSKNYSHDLH